MEIYLGKPSSLLLNACSSYKNIVFWKSHVRSILDALGISHYLTPEESQRPQENDAEAEYLWKAGEAKAKIVILQHIEHYLWPEGGFDELKVHEVWDRLITRIEDPNIKRPLRTLAEAQGITLSSCNYDVEEYIDRFYWAWAELGYALKRAGQQEPTEYYRSLSFILGTDTDPEEGEDSYRLWQGEIMGKKPFPPMDKIVQSLRLELGRRTMRNTGTTKAIVAPASSSKKLSSKQYKKKKNGLCLSCRNRHKVEDCWKTHPEKRPVRLYGAQHSQFYKALILVSTITWPVSWPDPLPYGYTKWIEFSDEDE